VNKCDNLKTHTEQVVNLMYRLRPGDVIEYEASGGGRDGSVTARVSRIKHWDRTYCIFGEGLQEGEYVLFPDGRPSGQKFDPPEACFINEDKEDSLANMELLTHGTIEWMKLIVNSEVTDNFSDS